MGLAEDASKVQRITTGSAAALRQLYSLPLLRQAEPGLCVAADTRLQRPADAATTAGLAARLPHVRPSHCAPPWPYLPPRLFMPPLRLLL